MSKSKCTTRGAEPDPASGVPGASANDLHVVAAVIHHHGRILTARRLAGGPSGRKWEFRGGKLEAGETPREALIREINEELGLNITVGGEIGTFITLLDSLRIRLQCFDCSTQTANVTLNAHSEVRWLKLEQLRRLDWALPDIPVIERLMQRKAPGH